MLFWQIHHYFFPLLKISAVRSNLANIIDYFTTQTPSLPEWLPIKGAVGSIIVSTAECSHFVVWLLKAIVRDAGQAQLNLNQLNERKGRKVG